MSLIDHFNAFQVISERRRLSPNAQSLYYAILAQFNKKRYPENLYLTNGYLQQLSGIKSNSSFDAARTALINVRAIAHFKNYYRLRTGENMPTEISKKNPGNNTESEWNFDGNSLGLFLVPNTQPERENRVEKKENFSPTTTTAGAGAREGLQEIEKTTEARKPAKPSVVERTREETVSQEIYDTWYACENERLHGAVMLGLLDLEKRHGTNTVIRAITEASLANSKPRLSFKFVKSFIPGESRYADKARSKIEKIIKKEGKVDERKELDETWAKRCDEFLSATP